MKIALFIIGVFVFFLIIWVFAKQGNKPDATEDQAILGAIAGYFGVMGFYGFIIIIAIWILGTSFSYLRGDNESEYDNTPTEWGPGAEYDNTPTEWGPGTEYDSNPGVHNVDGYYRSDGTYVDPYIRSNPDGNPYNNLNQ